MNTANESSMRRHAVRSRQQPSRPSASATIEDVVADLERLVFSTSRDNIRERLREEVEVVREEPGRTQVPWPRHLQIQEIKEDPLEFRRDWRGVPVIHGRNVLGEHYAPLNDPLRFCRGQDATKIFQRMKRVVREDLRTRNQRRIAALNAKEAQRKQMLEQQGVLTPEQQLEAKLDRMFEASPAS